MHPAYNKKRFGFYLTIINQIQEHLIPFQVSRVNGVHLRGLRQGPNFQDLNPIHLAPEADVLPLMLSV